MLAFQQAIPADAQDGAPLFVLLHGRGSDDHDLLGLKPLLPANAMLVTPRAPYPAAPWGYGPGWAWYRLQSPGVPDPDHFSATVAQLDEFLTELAGHLPVKPGPIIVGGFSQGAATSIGFALTRPGRVDRCLVFSGFIPDHPAVSVTPERVAGLSIFWGHGTQDNMIAYALAEKGQAQLRAAGADLTARSYPMGHTIEPRELADVVEWLK